MISGQFFSQMVRVIDHDTPTLVLLSMLTVCWNVRAVPPHEHPVWPEGHGFRQLEQIASVIAQSSPI